MTDRTYSQYRQDPVTVSWLSIVSEMSESIRQAAEKVRSSYDIDSASEHDLEVIGAIVGAERSRLVEVRYDSVISALEIPDFPDADGTFLWFPPFYGNGMRYGEGVRYQTGVQEVLARIVDLDDYRDYIKARIQYNISDGTIDGVLRIAETLTGVNASDLALENDPSAGKFSLVFYANISESKGDILNFFDVIPEPPCVVFAGWVVNL